MIKRIYLPLLVIFTALLCMMFLLNTGSTYAESESESSCITSSCHPKMGKDKFVHGPVDEGECEVCHGEAEGHRENPQKNKFVEIEEVSEICYSCHEQFEERKVTHSPVDDGECTACHSPHGSPYKFQLRANGSDLCFQCHDEELVGEKFVHGPAAAGGCIACHEPHTANYEKNLRAEPPELCYMCHTAKAEAIKGSEFVHTPVAESCVNCHSPHSAPAKFMLPADPPELCLNCHKKKKAEIAAAKNKHGAVKIKKACLNCHDAHASNIDKNLRMEPMDLCLSCHYESLKTDEDQKELINMKEWLEENKDHHGPIKQKDCSGCHNPHGSDNFRILRRPYPPTFYKAFKVENYNLCFGCHEKTLVLNPETTKLTNFRNGNMNLHYKHVNKPVKGRTCRACHETHASNNPKHIRDGVPFGTWSLPLNYKKTETGGSCTPGCHKLKRYDREKKEING